MGFILLMQKPLLILPLSSRYFLLAFISSLTVMALAGCRADGTTLLSPYKMEIVQGNFISKEQAALIQPGVTKNQVRTVLGSPLVTDIFHEDRWDYAFSIKRKGALPMQRRMTIFFEGNVVSSVDIPEELLTEEEFIQYLEHGRPDSKTKVRELVATPEQLAAAERKAQDYREREDARMEEQGSSARPANYYPPLD